MGIFDFLTGRDNQQTQTQSSQVVEDTNIAKSAFRGTSTAEAQERGTVAASSRNDSTTQQVDQRFLGQDIETLLGNLIKGLGDQSGVLPPSAGTFGAGGKPPNANAVLGDNAVLLDIIRNRATALPGKIEGDIAGIVGEARRQGEDQLTANTTAAAQASGSAQGSLVTDIENSGRAELESRLAGITGQLGLQGIGVAGQELATAFAGGDTLAKSTSDIGALPVEQITQLAEVLKGATQQGTTTGAADSTQLSEEQQVTNSLRSVLEALEELTKGKTVRTSEGTSTGSSSSSGSILDIFDSLAGLIASGNSGSNRPL